MTEPEDDIDENEQSLDSAFEEDCSLPNSMIEIYDPNEIRRRLNADNDRSFDFESSLSHEEEGWRRRLKALIRHPRAACRKLLFGDEAMRKRTEGLKQNAPHFGDVLDLVSRSIQLSIASGAPLRIPPLLLLGGPGVGKTYVARQIAEALETFYDHISVDTMSERGTLTGLSLSWKGARPGRIANAILQSPTASPIIVVDEADKASSLFAGEHPLSFLHTVLEPENSSRFTDEYLTVPMRADCIFWILTANSIADLPPSILDRLIIFEIEAPSRKQLYSILQNIYSDSNCKYRGYFAQNIDDQVLHALSEVSPRTARKLIELAFGFAHDGSRKHLVPNDIADAHKLIAGDAELSRPGFL